jgi:hypothetical protein
VITFFPELTSAAVYLATCCTVSFAFCDIDAAVFFASSTAAFAFASRDFSRPPKLEGTASA